MLTSRLNTKNTLILGGGTVDALEIKNRSEFDPPPRTPEVLTLDKNPSAKPDVMADLRKGFPEELKSNKFDVITIERCISLAFTSETFKDISTSLHTKGLLIAYFSGSAFNNFEQIHELKKQGFKTILPISGIGIDNFPLRQFLAFKADLNEASDVLDQINLLSIPMLL